MWSRGLGDADVEWEVELMVWSGSGHWCHSGGGRDGLRADDGYNGGVGVVARMEEVLLEAKTSGGGGKEENASARLVDVRERRRR